MFGVCVRSGDLDSRYGDIVARLIDRIRAMIMVLFHIRFQVRKGMRRVAVMA